VRCAIMAVAGPWFISPHAVQRYRERVRDVAPQEALDALVDVASRAHFVRELPSGLALWRGPRPLRLRLRVAKPTTADDLPSLVTVMAGCDAATRPKMGGR